jgi:hypothetical protein
MSPIQRSVHHTVTYGDPSELPMQRPIVFVHLKIGNWFKRMAKFDRKIMAKFEGKSWPNLKENHGQV